MAIKTLIFLLFVITLANKCWSKESFIVIASSGYSETEKLKAIYVAEQVRIKHGKTDKGVIAGAMKEGLDAEIGRHQHCSYCLAGVCAMAHYVDRYTIHLQSDQPDNMVFMCFAHNYIGRQANVNVSEVIADGGFSYINNQAAMLNYVNPRKDSFIVRNFQGYREIDLAIIIAWAEEARKRHSIHNRPLISFELQAKLDAEYGKYHQCWVNFDSKGAVAIRNEIYLVHLYSDNGDTLEILCWTMNYIGRAQGKSIVQVDF